MHINSNEILSQNQLAIEEVTHKFYIHTQALEFYQCGTIPLSYSNTPPHVWAINKAQHVHTIFNQTGTVAIKIEHLGSDTMLNFYINLGIKQTSFVYKLK